MPCECENTECLEVVIDRCEEDITLPLLADETETWRVVIEFNGISISNYVEVTDGESIVIPNNLNENYRHTLKIYDADDNLFNDTCYIIHSSITV